MSGTTGFFLGAAALLLIVLAILVRPLLRQPNASDSVDRRQANLDMLRDVRGTVSVPLVASGGAGEPAHFTQAAQAGADAVLAASVFHFGTLTIGQVKDDMRAAGIPVR